MLFGNSICVSGLGIGFSARTHLSGVAAAGNVSPAFQGAATKFYRRGWFIVGHFDFRRDTFHGHNNFIPKIKRRLADRTGFFPVLEI